MRRLTFALAAVAAWFATDAAAQNPPPGVPSPRVSNVFPAGAKVGTTVEVVTTGFDQEGPTGLVFSHAGIKGEYVKPEEPKPDPKDPKKKLPPPDPNGPHTFKVSVAGNVPPGTYDLRLVGKWGVSNAKAFVVGTLPEVNEVEPNNDVPEAQKVEVGTTVNGVIQNGTDVDYTVFTGKKGQRVLISCLATSIDSKARPMIEVFDPSGRKLATNRNYRNDDALADLTIPADGDYYVRLFEFTYQFGSPDHVYRLTLSTRPWIDAVFPAAVEPGKPTPVTLYGRNLPNGQPSEFAIDGRPLEKLAVTVNPPGDVLAAQRLAPRGAITPNIALQNAFEYRLGDSNPVPIFFTREKLAVKQNAGGTTPETAEAIPVPCEAVGMLHRPGDRDWYSFDAKKDQAFVIDLLGGRVGSPADFYFTVHNPANKNQMIGAEQDDDNDPLHPVRFYDRTGDPAPLTFTAPADGKYLIAVGCREASFLYGPRTAYRLRVAPPKPDFRVVVGPYSRNYQTGSAGRRDATECYEVFVHRMDGFNGAVTVTAEGLPGGVSAKPLLIGPGARWGVLVLHVAGGAGPFTGTIKIRAAATIGGKPEVREGRPATVLWGTQPNQNNPLLARLTDELFLAVRPEPGFFTITADPAAAKIKPAKGNEEKAKVPMVVRQGDRITLPVKVNWTAADKQNLNLQFDEIIPNQNNTLFQLQATKQPTKDKPEGEVAVTIRPNCYPGTYNIVVRGECQLQYMKNPEDKKKVNIQLVEFSDPVEFTVVPTTLAKVRVNNLPNNAVKVGESAEMVVQVDRQYDYAGEYKVKYTLPNGVTGVTVSEGAIKPGETEAKLVVKAAADAKPGGVNGGTITVTALFDGRHEVTDEAKVNFNVAK